MSSQNFPYPDTFVVVNRFRMHYYHSGTEDPIIVLMLHGSRSSAHEYRRFFPHLVDAGFRCFAPDLIGFGQSDIPKDPSIHSFDFHSDNLETFIRELGLRNLILIGHEWGSLIALDYAINRSDNTLALILTDSGVFLPNRNPGLNGLLNRSILGKPLAHQITAKLRRSRPQEHSQDGQPTTASPAANLGFRRMAAHADRGYNALRMKALRNSLPTLRIPTLLIRSPEPQLFSNEEFDFLQQQLPYVRSQSLPSAGPIHDDHPNIVINSILDFLNPIATPSPSGSPFPPSMDTLA